MEHCQSVGVDKLHKLFPFCPLLLIDGKHGRGKQSANCRSREFAKATEKVMFLVIAYTVFTSPIYILVHVLVGLQLD